MGPVTQFDPNGHVAIQVTATLVGVGVGIYNAMQNPCWSMKSLATAAVIGGAVGFASTFGAGPLSATFFGGGSAAAGSALEQSILGEVDWGTVGTAAAWGVGAGFVGNTVGRAIAPKVTVDYGITGSSAMPRPPGRTQRMYARNPVRAPNKNVVGAVGVGAGIGAAGNAATSSTTNTCGC